MQDLYGDFLVVYIDIDCVEYDDEGSGITEQQMEWNICLIKSQKK